jgi:glycerol-3-phosphate dehydrogenase (NAD(P)+)
MTTAMNKLAVLGAGAWGTALALHYARRYAVCLWTIDASHARTMQAERSNTALLPGYPFPASLTPTAQLEEAVHGADAILIVTPVVGLRPTCRALRQLAVRQPLIWACKGLEVGSHALPHQVVADELGADYPAAVFSGPSFAQEVAAGLPAAVTLASTDAMLATRLANSLHGETLRVYHSTDVVGVEVGGAVKNVMAVAAGIADGLGFGLNARAALMTRGLAEMARLGVALGAQAETFMGLSGMGDLVLTCTGDLSRNRRVGLMLATGKPLADILAELGHVAEGVLAAPPVYERARALGVDMPITGAVCAVLSGQLTPQVAVQQLLARAARVESLA